MAYWRKLKQREPQLVTICHGLKLPAKDGKLRYTEVEGAAKRGGRVAGNARKETEKELGHSITPKENYLSESEKKKKLQYMD